MAIFQQKLKHLKGEIKRWNHTTFGNIFKAKAAQSGNEIYSAKDHHGRAVRGTR